MIIKNIAAICKKSKQIRITENDGIQWVGNSYAMYPLYNLPCLDQNNVYTIFDFNEKQKNSTVFINNELKNICLDDICEKEVGLEPNGECIIHADSILKSFKCSLGIAFIDMAYLKPLKDAENGLLFYERFINDSVSYIAVKSGFMLLAVIMPVDVINEDYIEKTENFLNACKLSYENKLLREKESNTVNNNSEQGKL